jgi:hypothetical protein
MSTSAFSMKTSVVTLSRIVSAGALGSHSMILAGAWLNGTICMPRIAVLTNSWLAACGAEVRVSHDLKGLGSMGWLLRTRVPSDER